MNMMTAIALILTLAALPALTAPMQQSHELLAQQTMAVAYSGFREGQHPDRGSGAVNPSDTEILEDLQILQRHGFELIRLYDSGDNSAATLRIIQQHQIPIKVLLGIWLDAEVSNHEGCAWLDAPIPEGELQHNMLKNKAEIQRSISLANEFPDIVIAVNVGNEALVSWNDHMVPVASVVQYVRQVKAATTQPITVADNYEWWIKHGAVLAKELDFIGVHTYPMWEHKTIEQAIAYTVDNIAAVQQALPHKPIAVLEAGWATTAREFPVQANEAAQARYYAEVSEWAKANNMTFFFFEAFDEPWKGDPTKADGAEKHWGLFNVKRQPKQAMQHTLEVK
ncbi:glycosyl hydrolase [Echinimonas agarilytica]|uniref:Endo-1,3-beta-glucanase btgC n=1 Tax=Echinimonas agarilytica TaxID=1215918 RepID=A0AA41W4J8_9GAMM|nr:glycosyl hydrolase [Echinimonas agarilytica]MCM2678373.1 glycosyl hydrolase [Echinimonas agarilytica]